jgi:hypothetical protein
MNNAALNPTIKDIPIPRRMRDLPIDERGYPVPYFVTWIDGKPEFRVMDMAKWRVCVSQKKCWLCGEPLGKLMAFVLGPMCAINRVNSEPPSHLECAKYAAVACPFLSRPHMKRREDELTKTAIQAGSPILRNPGAVAVWVTNTYKTFRAPNGVLLEVGDPAAVFWYCQGREATRAEVLNSIRTGIPLLEETLLFEDDPAAARKKLTRSIERALGYLPPGEETLEVISERQSGHRKLSMPPGFHGRVKRAITLLSVATTYAEDGALGTACDRATEAAEMLRILAIEKSKALYGIDPSDVKDKEARNGNVV